MLLAASTVEKCRRSRKSMSSSQERRVKHCWVLVPCECHLYRSFRNLAKQHLSSESDLETRYCKGASNHVIHQSTNLRCNSCDTHTTIWFEVWPHRRNVLPHHTWTGPSTLQWWPHMRLWGKTTLTVTCVTLLEKTRPSANFAQGQLLMSKPYVIWCNMM